MQILIYAMLDSSIELMLERMLLRIPGVTISVFNAIQKFYNFIAEHRIDPCVIITVVERSKDFYTLHSLFEHNEPDNLIIICDDTAEMISLAHELRPRYLAHFNDLDKVKAVVEKMMHLVGN
ncbi:MAG TPA: hypothetical protein VMU30_11485 [Bacteroidota bacterium]|nr:hypothetical protein [Bacteroidota bacterium]